MYGLTLAVLPLGARIRGVERPASLDELWLVIIYEAVVLAVGALTLLCSSKYKGEASLATPFANVGVDVSSLLWFAWLVHDPINVSAGRLL
jgi:hypothetical protein